MKRLVLGAAAAAALLAAPAAQAQTGGVHEHDGFYLHLELGGGALNSTAKAGADKLEVSGGASQIGLSLGGAVTPNFIVAGQFWSTGVSDPTIKRNGTKVDAPGTNSAGFGGIGLELTYVFMPLDLYVSVVPTLGVVTSKANGVSGSSERGFACKFAVGKEWWVSDNWGLGLNLQYAFGSNKDKEEVGVTTATVTSNYFGAALSASFN